MEIMGLTVEATGKKLLNEVYIKKEKDTHKIIALAGNPNVGKSTIFNTLTGLNQHTGNWAGKTVEHAMGTYIFEGDKYLVFDLPGTYSLLSHSVEEMVARDFICFQDIDVLVVICDATCLERNLNLVLQTLEITHRVVVCVNLMDEARKKEIQVNLEELERQLGVPVIGTSARNKEGLEAFKRTLKYSEVAALEAYQAPVKYSEDLESAIFRISQAFGNLMTKNLNYRFLALKLLEGNEKLLNSMDRYLGYRLMEQKEVAQILQEEKQQLSKQGLQNQKIKDEMVHRIIVKAETIANDVVEDRSHEYRKKQVHIDRILTSKRWGIPLMLLLLGVVFWITIVGANFPSQLLANAGFWIQDQIIEVFQYLHVPLWFQGIFVDGMLRVLFWVIAVMLPPMAIFFPFFTLLEDLGYLPRIAFNLDHHFKKACACGKQGLCMAMGFGCNAAGVVGCRIIDSKRERLIAILTNNFVPCNGRFPTLIAIISMFFFVSGNGFLNSIASTGMLMAVVLMGILLTFMVSRGLSKTLLKGYPSSFTLELPPYRRPQIGKVIVRSIFDRTLFVLGRAMIVAAPAGVFIWLLANITVGDTSILIHISTFLDPFARLMGLDGMILLAFILGFPANEIVIPIMIMGYLNSGKMIEFSNLMDLKAVLLANGWTYVTAISTMIFCLVHWPCSTTCLTIRKEAGGTKWMLLSIAIPTVIGILLCMAFTGVTKIIM